MYTVLLHCGETTGTCSCLHVHRSPDHFRILEETDKSQQEVEDGVERITGLHSTRPAALHWRNHILWLV